MALCTEFAIGMTDKQTSQVFEELVSLVPFVSSLDVTYRVHEAWKESSELSSFYRLLQVAPEVEELTLEDTDVKDPPSTYNLPHLHRLYCVQFKGAIVDKQVLPSLSTIAPNLKHLTLNTCLLDTKCRQDHHIIMPQTDFKTISAITKKNSALLSY